MPNHSETYKSPYSLLNLDPTQPLSESWAEVLRKKRKEILAEFDLNQSPSLSFSGQAWTRSEVLAGFEELSQGAESYHHTIWKLGWLEFWKGGIVIPETMSHKATWSGRHQQAIWDDFEKNISHRLREFIRRQQFPAILDLLSFSFAVPSKVLKKAEAPISALLQEERREWRSRAFKISPEDPEEGYKAWYPAIYAALFCQLPKRYEEESRRWAEAVIDISVVQARYLTAEQRDETLIPTEPANKYWPDDLQGKWNGFQEYLSNVPMANSLAARRPSYKRIILLVLGVSLALGAAGFFLGKTSVPPIDYRNLPGKGAPIIPLKGIPSPMDSATGSKSNPDNETIDKLPEKSLDSISQSIP